jgi:hypothetical protein
MSRVKGVCIFGIIVLLIYGKAIHSLGLCSYMVTAEYFDGSLACSFVKRKISVIAL